MSEPTITDLKPVFAEFDLPPHVSLLPVLRALVTTRQRAEAAQIDHKDARDAYRQMSESELDALRKRAEAAEAERESVSSQLWDCMNEREALRAERDALRTVDDAMVERAARSLHASRESVFTHAVRIAWKNCGEHWHNKLRGAAKEALTAALAVQPTTEGM